MFLTREETTRVSAWRHPMKITMKTAADKDGRLVAHRVRILENTGPYTSFGPTVLDVCMEVAVGPYKWRSVEVEGYSIFTNYGLSGAFRGYGAPQANVGLESQIDIIAERLGIDPLEFRKRNVVKVGETSVWGHKEGGKAGVYETLLEAEKTDLWVNRSRIKQTSRRPWIKIGVGMSAAMKGVGYGATPDTAAAMMSMKSDGAVVAGISPVEIGQGNMTGYAAVASEILRCDMRRIQVSTGNTDVPNGGGSSASKALYVAGSALVNAAESLVAQILTQASKMLNASLEELDHKDLRVFVKDQPSISLSFADVVKTLGGELRVEGQFDVPRVSSAIPGSLQIPHIIHSFATTVAQVEVDTMTGVVKVKRIIFVPEAGRVINRDAFVGQCVGGVVQGMGFGLCEDAVLDKGVLKTNNFTTYIIPAAGDIPRIEVLPVDGYEDTGPLGIKGVSELPVVPIAAAILDAIHDAVGIRMRQVPATPQRVYALLHQST
jgi:CO/xanthine dehydrogenase Mo-binding subunit